MFKIFANHHHNWILVLAVTLGIVLGIVALFIDIHLPVNRVNQFDGMPILLLIVFGSIIAPILEELCYRGFFSNSNKLKIVALLGFLSYAGMVLYNKYPVVLVSVVLTLVMTSGVYYHKYKNNAAFVFFVIGNAVVFGLVHYGVEDFVAQGNPFVLAQIALGLFFTWITINFGLIKAMLFHGTYNLVLLTVTFLSLHFVSEGVQIIERNNVKISYQQVPILESGTTTVLNRDATVIAKNTTIKRLLDLAVIDSNLRGKYSSIVPMARYDFIIEFKDGKRNFEPVLKLLSEEELIIEN